MDGIPALYPKMANVCRNMLSCMIISWLNLIQLIQYLTLFTNNCIYFCFDNISTIQMIGWLVNNDLWMYVEGSCFILLQVLSWYLPRGTEQNYGKLSVRLTCFTIGFEPDTYIIHVLLFTAVIWFGHSGQWVTFGIIWIKWILRKCRYQWAWLRNKITSGTAIS
jgi:hypothetical protein